MAKKLKAKKLSGDELDALASFDNPTAAAEENRQWAEQRDSQLAEFLEAEPEEDDEDALPLQ